MRRLQHEVAQLRRADGGAAAAAAGGESPQGALQGADDESGEVLSGSANEDGQVSAEVAPAAAAAAPEGDRSAAAHCDGSGAPPQGLERREGNAERTGKSRHRSRSPSKSKSSKASKHRSRHRSSERDRHSGHKRSSRHKRSRRAASSDVSSGASSGSSARRRRRRRHKKRHRSDKASESPSERSRSRQRRQRSPRASPERPGDKAPADPKAVAQSAEAPDGAQQAAAPQIAPRELAQNGVAPAPAQAPGKYSVLDRITSTARKGGSGDLAAVRGGTKGVQRGDAGEEDLSETQLRRLVRFHKNPNGWDLA